MDDPVQTQQQPVNSQQAPAEGSLLTDPAKVNLPNGQPSTSVQADPQPTVALDNSQQELQKSNAVTLDAQKIGNSTADNTILDHSKQQTQKQVSAAKSLGEESSSSDDDEPHDFVKTSKAPNQADSAIKTDNQAVPNNQSAQPLLQDQTVAQQNDTVLQSDKIEEKPETSQPNLAAVVLEDASKKEPEPQAPTVSVSEPVVQSESQRPTDAQPNDQNVDNTQKIINGSNEEQPKPESNSPVNPQLNGQQADQVPANKDQNDVDIKDNNDKPKEVTEQVPEQPNGSPVKQEENQQNPVPQVNGQQAEVNNIGEKNDQQKVISEPNQAEKSQIDAQAQQDPKSISKSQMLWGQGVAQRDADMMDEEEDQDESNESENIDKELKQKCLAAQGPDKLFTLNIDTYKVCQLNTILSSLGLRLELKEQVLKFQKQKERDERNRIIRENKIQQKMAKQKYNWQKQKQRDYPNQEMAGGHKHNAMYKQQSEDAYNSQFYKSANSNDTSKPEGAHLMNDPQSMSRQASHVDKDTKMGSSEAQMITAADKQAELGAEATSSKDQPQSGIFNPIPGAMASANAELKAGTTSPDPKNMNELDLKALSPQIRKSERDKTPVSYSKMDKAGLSDSDEENANMVDPSQPSHMQGGSNGQKIKKSQDQLHNAAKKHSVDESNKRIADMFAKLSQHQYSALMNQPLSKNCPMFEQFRHEWQTLTMIDMQHRCKKYTNSKEILTDINSMILNKFSYFAKTGESEDSLKLQEFQQYFDNIVRQQQLTNLLLVNKPEQKPKPKPKPMPEPEQNKDKKKKSKPSSSFKNEETTTKEGLLDDGPTVIPCKPAVQPLTSEQLAELKRDIVNLKEEQRADIEKVVPECITTNAQGNKNIELNRLQQNPETAAKLLKYVQTQTKKNQQRERRRQIDVRRRQQKKALNNAKQKAVQGDVSFANPADPSKQVVAAQASVAGNMATQPQQAQELLATAQAQAMQQAQLQQNPQQALLGLGGAAAFNNKAAAAGFMGNPLQMAGGQAAQQQLMQQLLMNGFLGQQGMNPQTAAAMQQMTAMFQMQQAQAQQVPQKQANPGQVGGMQPQDSQNTQMPAVPKKAVAKPPAQDESMSSSSDSESV